MASKAKLKIFKIPAGLPKAGRQLWAAIVALDDGQLEDLDFAALTICCQSYGTFCDAMAAVKREGMVIDSPQGKKKNPMLTIAKEAADRFRPLMGEFGLSPAARNRILAAVTMRAGGCDLTPLEF